jgi:hypothetical protein
MRHSIRTDAGDIAPGMATFSAALTQQLANAPPGGPNQGANTPPGAPPTPQAPPGTVTTTPAASSSIGGIPPLALGLGVAALAWFFLVEQKKGRRR